MRRTAAASDLLDVEKAVDHRVDLVGDLELVEVTGADRLSRANVRVEGTERGGVVDRIVGRDVECRDAARARRSFAVPLTHRRDARHGDVIGHGTHVATDRRLQVGVMAEG